MAKKKGGRPALYPGKVYAPSHNVGGYLTKQGKAAFDRCKRRLEKAIGHAVSNVEVIEELARTRDARDSASK